MVLSEQQVIIGWKVPYLKKKFLSELQKLNYRHKIFYFIFVNKIFVVVLIEVATLNRVYKEILEIKVTLKIKKISALSVLKFTSSLVVDYILCLVRLSYLATVILLVSFNLF